MNLTSKKVIAVTGGARGIGRHIALAFAKLGWGVHICDRDDLTLQSTVRELCGLGHDVSGICLDLSVAGHPQRMVREIASSAGRLDVLINNAQSTIRSTFLDESEETWDAGMAVTLKAAFFASQEAARVMAAAGGGAIVNIASIAAILATHESPSYHMAKAGLVQMTRYLAVEAGRYGVRVNCVSPAFIVQDEHRARFDSVDNAGYRELVAHYHPMEEPGSSEDVAQAVVFLCSAQATFINGQNVILDGGASLSDQFCLLQDFSTRQQKK